MLVKAIKTFTDKRAHAVVPMGALLDIPEVRFKELNKAAGAPYVEVYTSEAVAPAPEAKAKK